MPDAINWFNPFNSLLLYNPTCLISLTGLTPLIHCTFCSVQFVSLIPFLLFSTIPFHLEQPVFVNTDFLQSRLLYASISLSLPQDFSWPFLVYSCIVPPTTTTTTTTTMPTDEQIKLHYSSHPSMKALYSLLCCINPIFYFRNLFQMSIFFFHSNNRYLLLFESFYLNSIIIIIISQ